jgi:hypothetical protein
MGWESASPGIALQEEPTHGESGHRVRIESYGTRHTPPRREGAVLPWGLGVPIEEFLPKPDHGAPSALVEQSDALAGDVPSAAIRKLNDHKAATRT